MLYEERYARWPVRRTLFSLQVFLLMCTPLPQASYAAVGFGRTVGLSMGLMLALYTASDVVGFLTVRWLTRHAGRPGLARLRRRLPQWLGRRLDRGCERAAIAGRGAVTAPAMFAAGYANLYLAALVAGFSRMRLLPALLYGITGDLVQFTGTVALAGMLARLLPFPGADWAALLAAPVLLGLVPAGLRLGRPLERYLRRPRPAFLPPALVPVRVPVPSKSHNIPAPAPTTPLS